MSDTPLLILGLGNVLLGDDGVGPAVIARLAICGSPISSQRS